MFLLQKENFIFKLTYISLSLAGSESYTRTEARSLLHKEAGNHLTEKLQVIKLYTLTHAAVLKLLRQNINGPISCLQN